MFGGGDGGTAGDGDGVGDAAGDGATVGDATGVKVGVALPRTIGVGLGEERSSNCMSLLGGNGFISGRNEAFPK
jgi:hypothetical protein